MIHFVRGVGGDLTEAFRWSILAFTNGISNITEKHWRQDVTNLIKFAAFERTNLKDWLKGLSLSLSYCSSFSTFLVVVPSCPLNILNSRPLQAAWFRRILRVLRLVKAIHPLYMLALGIAEATATKVDPPTSWKFVVWHLVMLGCHCESCWRLSQVKIMIKHVEYDIYIYVNSV